MKRDAQKLESGPFDLLVIGGGIYGAWTAYDAALRGLKVALIEKGDWASGTSSASSKLIHGGLRYLEQFRFGLVKKSLDERKRLARLAPHRVTPLRFLIPIYRDSPTGPLRMKIGLFLYDIFAWNDQPVKPHLSLTARELPARYPFLKKRGLKGGFTYGDCQMDDARFTLEIVEGAYQAGAVTVNYAKAEKLLIENNRVTGAAVTDLYGNQGMEVHASVVVNTAGPWAGSLCGEEKRSDLVRLVKGIHLVMPPLPTGDAMLIMVKKDKRIFFMIPWYGKTLLGTTDSDYHGDPDRVQVNEEDIDYLLSGASRVFRKKTWDRSSILGSFAGLRALRNEPGKLPSQITREWSFEEPAERLLVSVGGKFTSARADAAELVDHVMQILERPFEGGPPTENRPFPWSPGRDYREWKEDAIQEGIQLGLDPEMASWSVFRYGVSLKEVHDLIRKEAALADRLVPELPFCKAEIVHAAASEMVLHLDDLLRRRIPLLILARVKKETLKEAAALAAPVLGWTEEMCQQEVESIRQQ
jgi:glycerol-3-phosphate dehydrogenase